MTTPPPGSITWRDLTVTDAERIRAFYEKVVGWTSTPHDMGDYADYNMNLAATGETVAGICHARGTNANVPPQWLMYINVADVQASARACVELGGAVLDGPRRMGSGLVAVIRDPAGAVCALWQST
jgi:uncharacterized protein